MVFEGGKMNAAERRKKLLDILKSNSEPFSGTYIAKVLNVSRQVIVQDIAILRAEGHDIIATPRGYLIPHYSPVKKYKRIIACSHDSGHIEDELKTIVTVGGTVIDAYVEHPLYGEIKGMLMISSLFDVDRFIAKMNKTKGQPLLVLTKGVHLHTIETDSEEKLEIIEKRLREKGYLVNTEA